MNSLQMHFDRGRLLHRQGRYSDAEREFRQMLTTEPNNSVAHALLADTLLEQQRADEATAEAGLAITHDPEMALGYFVMARVMYQRDRYDEAEQAVRRSLELEVDPNAFALLAAIRFDQRDWRGALQAADEGLAVDPDHSGCLNLRAMALRQLGLHEQADRTLAGALEKDPDDSFAHSNRGWSKLHDSRPDEALTHFREALRLDPSNDHARAGLVEAMKARYFFYRILLGYFLWMGRLQQSAQFAIVIGGWVGYQVLRAITRSNPQLGWITWPIMGTYVAFVWMSWLAAPLMDLALRLHPVGRHALSREQRLGANLVGGMLLAAAVVLMIGIFAGPVELVLAAVFFAIAALPASLVFRAEAGWLRLVIAAMTISLVAFTVTIGASELGLLPGAIANSLIPLTLPLLLICTLGAQWVASQRVKR